jgi:hypothetical protein
MQVKNLRTVCSGLQTRSQATHGLWLEDSKGEHYERAGMRFIAQSNRISLVIIF